MDKESLYRFFNGTASEAERIQIRNWADASPENMKELLRERKLYTAIVSRKKGILHKSENKIQENKNHPVLSLCSRFYRSYTVIVVYSKPERRNATYTTNHRTTGTIYEYDISRWQ